MTAAARALVVLLLAAVAAVAVQRLLYVPVEVASVERQHPCRRCHADYNDCLMFCVVERGPEGCDTACCERECLPQWLD